MFLHDSVLAHQALVVQMQLSMYGLWFFPILCTLLILHCVIFTSFHMWRTSWRAITWRMQGKLKWLWRLCCRGLCRVASRNVADNYVNIEKCVTTEEWYFEGSWVSGLFSATGYLDAAPAPELFEDTMSFICKIFLLQKIDGNHWSVWLVLLYIWYFLVGSDLFVHSVGVQLQRFF
jgi:hypothetical protein